MGCWGDAGERQGRHLNGFWGILYYDYNKDSPKIALVIIQAPTFGAAGASEVVEISISGLQSPSGGHCNAVFLGGGGGRGVGRRIGPLPYRETHGDDGRSSRLEPFEEAVKSELGLLVCYSMGAGLRVEGWLYRDYKAGKKILITNQSKLCETINELPGYNSRAAPSH